MFVVAHSTRLGDSRRRRPLHPKKFDQNVQPEMDETAGHPIDTGQFVARGRKAHFVGGQVATASTTPLDPYGHLRLRPTAMCDTVLADIVGQALAVRCCLASALAIRQVARAHRRLLLGNVSVCGLFQLLHVRQVFDAR